MKQKKKSNARSTTVLRKEPYPPNDPNFQCDTERFRALILENSLVSSEPMVFAETRAKRSAATARNRKDAHL